MTTQIVALLVGIFLMIVVGAAMIKAAVVPIDRRVRSLWQMNAKLDLLLKQAGIAFDPHENLPSEIADAIRRGDRIRAMTAYRALTGADLKETVQFIDEASRRIEPS